MLRGETLLCERPDVSPGSLRRTTGKRMRKRILLPPVSYRRKKYSECRQGRLQKREKTEKETSKKGCQAHRSDFPTAIRICGPKRKFEEGRVITELQRLLEEGLIKGVGKRKGGKGGSVSKTCEKFPTLPERSDPRKGRLIGGRGTGKREGTAERRKEKIRPAQKKFNSLTLSGSHEVGCHWERKSGLGTVLAQNKLEKRKKGSRSKRRKRDGAPKNRHRTLTNPSTFSEGRVRSYLHLTPESFQEWEKHQKENKGKRGGAVYLKD